AIIALGKVSDERGHVISPHARARRRAECIPVAVAVAVPDIINRNGDGICPVEQLCHACATPDECLPLITRFLSSIKQ
ncbi:MAG: DUF1893 domain-containing protein, partial [Muribaculaceae bacterium]|nr:DUF1893 domain-containing protein [Muribaculaceae bacterium]